MPCPKTHQKNEARGIHINNDTQSITSYRCLLFQNVDFGDFHTYYEGTQEHINYRYEMESTILSWI